MSRILCYKETMKSPAEDMTDKAPRKRGPKPIGAQPMSVSERQRRSREKKKQEGFSYFMVSLPKQQLAFIDQLAEAGALTRTETLSMLLDQAIANMAVAVAEATAAIEGGLPEEDVNDALAARIAAKIRPAIVQTYKETLGLK
jgi:hypothetical protein